MKELILELPITIQNVKSKKSIFESTNMNSISELFNSSSDDEEYQKERLEQELYESKNIIEKLEQEILELKGIKNIIKQNSNIRTKVEVSKSKCWWDRNKITGESYGLPCSLTNGECKTIGCFCSPNCMLAYNIRTMNDEHVLERTALIKQIYGEFSIAPPWQSLKEYGGYMTIKEFRDSFTQIFRKVSLIEPTIESIDLYIEESIKTNSVDKTKYVIKRSKPPNYNL